MADNALIRLENFRRLYPRDQVSIADLMQRFGRSASFWSQLRSGQKSFGEKLARSIEEADGLAPGCLDQPLGATRMPLSLDLLDHLASLPPDKQQAAEALLRIHLGLSVDVRHRKPQSGRG